MTRQPEPGRRPVERRVVLLGAAGVLLGAAGCTSGTPRPAPRSTAPSPSPRTPPGAAALPRTTPWRPTSAEIHPEVKLRAVQLVEAIGGWAGGKGGAAAARTRVAALRLPTGLVDQAGPLLPDADAAALQVVDAQYGGILVGSASVLVVCRQWTLRGGRVTAGGTTVGVRLVRTGSGWAVTALHPAHPGPAVASLPAAVRGALADPRIVLRPRRRPTCAAVTSTTASRTRCCGLRGRTGWR